jgi:hypothetical protein
MDTASIILVATSLFLAAVVLIVSHVRSWRAFQQAGLDEEEFDYRRRQFRRRMQTSAMLGVVAVAMLVGYGLTEWLDSSLFAALYWTAVMGLACWVALLALVDFWATKHHFDRLRHRCIVEQAKLQVELRRIQAVRSNGKAHSHDIAPKTEKREGNEH